MCSTESDLDKTLAFMQSEEFDKLIAATKEFWDECDYMGNPGAAEDDIIKLKETFTGFHKAPAPEGYFAFLRKLNGFKYRDFDIYSCEQAVNEHWVGFYFIFGTKKETFCSYDCGNGKYVTLAAEPFELLSDTNDEGDSAIVETTYHTRETYDSFAELFKTILMHTLPAEKLCKVYPALKGW